MEEDFKLNDAVIYKGENRPWLKDRPGKILAFNLTKTSAKVSFQRDDGFPPYEEWVGVGSLLLVEESVAPSSAEDLLRQELREVSEQFGKVSSEFRRLSTRKLQLENALRALNATFR